MTRERRIRWISSLGLLVAVGVFLVMVFVAPDGGFDPEWVRWGLAYASVFAAPPLALLLTHEMSGLPVAVGGGMLMAGMVTTPGGNLLGLVMAAVGLLILFVAGPPLPPLRAPLVLKLAAYGIVLTSAVWLVFDGRPLATVLVLLLAVLVATSGRFSWVWPGVRA